jgi:hypothetical protein
MLHVSGTLENSEVKSVEKKDVCASQFVFAVGDVLFL